METTKKTLHIDLSEGNDFIIYLEFKESLGLISVLNQILNVCAETKVIPVLDNIEIKETEMKGIYSFKMKVKKD